MFDKKYFQGLFYLYQLCNFFSESIPLDMQKSFHMLFAVRTANIHFKKFLTPLSNVELMNIHVKQICFVRKNNSLKWNTNIIFTK